ncbi:uracil phosphoribosyltransferase [Flavobacterium agricola]|uniref:Uracil phosphoribosyltransferase n=1 Tax=Flavobacterium agricola TaxID=2870839 RepID=A0ABY6LX51_9FLAO|nr:uracil phosphoribosyltransferase [Flavobacterium agricola]UYW00907.1 uracil phosphoribosyltransferase [Flavobacterium agricola]
MTSFFNGLGWFIGDFLMTPMNALAKLELSNWWLANFITWIFIIILCAAFGYWMKQLAIFHESGADEQDTTAHSFLK